MLDAYKHLQKKDLKYFKTLHSLAFNRLGMKKAQVMQDEHYEDIGRKLGIEVTVYSNGQENTGFVDSNSEYFNLINAARIKEISIEDEYNTGMYSYELEKNLLYILEGELNNYKDSFKLYDFTDMIEKFNVAKLCPKYDVVFVDEAQDLSPIQWKMVDILRENSKYVILAGDDDQAIYGWAGADVLKFIATQAKKDIILPQSYRVPRTVQDIANKILDRIPNDRRVKKNWSPRDKDGTVNYITTIDDAPLYEDNWLVLARTNDRLEKIKSSLRDMGIYFQFKGRKSFTATLFRSILNYTRWQSKGDMLSLSEVKDIFEYTQSYHTIREEKLYDLQEFGFSNTQRWYDVFKSNPDECLYIREMLRQEENLHTDARVQLSTIHSAKGGQADNVLLILDNTKTIREATEKSDDKHDEEHRVWYVGVTRTKQNLYIMTAKREDKGYDIESLG
jgi:DNA helicase-2/ATP-dependent DNA helicase PcrA